ncbi:hypothetical protein FEM48_Zijuj10G0044400 [Ziziphus jujuba var. spinosa]|uniref:RING-type domain-containing protein n=1 Tax=Ziziphus jujuba var. spinosa TaxID=714518 RepID=A0A978ULA5_ZIZJJ|nr:hypothetical protein FEM48_Zijuj10G0044400 [Ziziphus jujuba var. spinosa]
MEMMCYQLARSSYQDFLKVLEADVQYANSLAAAIPRGKGGARLQMKLVYTDGRPNISTHGRKATIKDFYAIALPSLYSWVLHSDLVGLLKTELTAIILPSLERLHGDFEKLDDAKEGHSSIESSGKKMIMGEGGLANVDMEREDECGICLEPCTKMVLPNCCHAMCIKCYRNWNTKSESCPFCRGNIKRVNSEDLWVLTCNDDVVDTETVSEEDLLRFYLYINSLPKDHPDSLFFVYYEYLI